MEIDFVMGTTQVHIMDDGYTEIGCTLDDKWVALSGEQVKELISRWLLATHKDDSDEPTNFTTVP